MKEINKITIVIISTERFCKWMVFDQEINSLIPIAEIIETNGKKVEALWALPPPFAKAAAIGAKKNHIIKIGLFSTPLNRIL